MYTTIIKSTLCAIVLTAGQTICQACAALVLPNAPFRNVMRRCHKTDRWRDIRVSSITTARQTVAKLQIEVRLGRATITTLQHRILHGRLLQRSTLSTAAENVHRGNYKGALSHLEAHQQAGQHDKTCTALALVTTILNNLTQGSRGRKTQEETQHLLQVIRVMGGAKVYNVLSANLGLPVERTVRKWSSISRRGTPFVYGVCANNFIQVGNMYKRWKKRKGIELLVPVKLAEDETSINPALQWDYATDTLVGSCGAMCSGACTTVPQCVKQGCPDRHACAWQANDITIVVGDHAQSYEQVTQFYQKRRVARHLRAIIANPLHPDLPRLVLVLTGTCNTFSYRDYVKPQWDEVETMYDRYVAPILGPRIGHSSDGDPRRRHAFLVHSLTTTPRPYTINTPGFTHQGRLTDRQGCDLPFPDINLDQCYIHNGKKFINSYNLGTKHLRLGPTKRASMSHLVPVTIAHSKAEHGISKQDTDRHGMKAMDWPSAMRLFSRKALESLRNLIRQGGAEGKSENLEGDHRFLSIVRTYVSIYMSNASVTHLKRIHEAAVVTTYLRLWHAWCIHTPGISTAHNFITREAFQDAVMSCHDICLLIKIFRDHFPTLQIPYSRLGSDVCEDYFSSLGSFAMNKRTYTIMEALQSTRSQMHLVELESMGNVVIPKARSRKKGIWDDEHPAPNPVPGPDWPSDNAINEAWQQGDAAARVMAQEDGMQPKPLRPRGTVYPDWWSRPHEFDPTCRGDYGKDEEDLWEETEDEGESSDDPQADMEESSNSDDELTTLVGSAAASAEMEEEEKTGAISQTLSVPFDTGRWHKAKLLAHLNDGHGKLSADRGIRVQQGRQVNHTFNAAADEWLICLGSDVAVNFGNNIWLGRVERMRKKNRSWTDYRLPVVLTEDRTTLGELVFECRWYRRVPGGPARRFQLKEIDYDEYHITTVICPVTMHYEATRDIYTLDPGTADILRKASAGDVEWEIPSLANR